MQLKQLLFKILDLAEIKEDQENILIEFEEKLAFATQLDLYDLVKEEDKKTYNNALLEAAGDTDKIEKIFNNYFKEEDIVKAYSKNVELFFNKLITDIFEDPTQKQLEELNRIISEFKQ